jgi:hypothetical protein
MKVETSDKITDNPEVRVDAVLQFFHELGDLCRKHKVYATDVKLEWAWDDPAVGEPMMQVISVESYYDPPA